MTAAASTEYSVQTLRELYTPNEERIALARARQAAVFKGETPDAWPILMGGPLGEDWKALPRPDRKEAFYSADAMLFQQMRSAAGANGSNSDSVPSIRVNTGTGTCLALLGLEQEVYPDKMPWPKEHLSKSAISKLTPDDIKIQGTFARVLEYIARWKEVMGDAIPIYCSDTQGPFDLAHLIMGDAIFLELYDDPDFVHHLMEISLALGIKAHTLMKEAAGEPLDRHHHGCSLYAENMGIRICEDTSVLVSPDTIAEFCMPYTQRLARHFGGAWVHYCGCNENLTEAILEIPEIRAINFGHIPGHEEDHNFVHDMERILASGKVYFGGYPKREGESGEGFLRRMHHWASQGCLVPQCGKAVGKDGFAGVAEALDFWYSL